MLQHLTKQKMKDYRNFPHDLLQQHERWFKITYGRILIANKIIGQQLLTFDKHIYIKAAQYNKGSSPSYPQFFTWSHETLLPQKMTRSRIPNFFFSTFLPNSKSFQKFKLRWLNVKLWTPSFWKRGSMIFYSMFVKQLPSKSKIPLQDYPKRFDWEETYRLTQ